MNNSKKKDRLDSPEYRQRIGEKLKFKRIDLEFSINDIAYMTTITDNTVLNIEKGLTTNIDYYVEYAKAVGYPLESLVDFGIKLVPRRPLPKSRQERSNLTSKVRKLIIETEFSNSPKTVSEIKDELLRLEYIDIKTVSSTDIAGILRNLVKEKLLKTIGKDGRKNVYLKV